MLLSEVGFIAEALSFYHQRESATGGTYANTVNNKAGMDRHKTFNRLYRNALLRRSFQQAPWMFGIVVAQQHQLAEMKMTLDRFEALAQRLWRPIRLVMRGLGRVGKAVPTMVWTVRSGWRSLRR
jgi:hypothetical protein